MIVAGFNEVIVPTSFNSATQQHVTVEYRIPSARRGEFRGLMHALHAQRRRNGATHWHIDDDADHANIARETFELPNWLACVRHHERTTKQDLDLQQSIINLHEGP